MQALILAGNYKLMDDSAYARHCLTDYVSHFGYRYKMK